ncbi:MAG: hypothetical protein J6Y29_06695 [Clostridiales bacterium]|nr:hypothetical protein [Clostridiales bacterium]
MKRIFGNLLCAMVVFLSGVSSAFAADATVLSETKSLNVLKRVENGIVLVPLREVVEFMDYDVSWYASTKEIKVAKDFKGAVYKIDRKSVISDNVLKKINVAPKILDGKTYVSLDAIEKGLGLKVHNSKDGLTFTRDNYKNENWLKIVPIKKVYNHKDNSGKVLASVSVEVPQVENSQNKEGLEKINNYYRDVARVSFDEYKKLLPSDLLNRMGKEVRYEDSFFVTYNANDVLSIATIHRNKSNVTVKCDVFDMNTGDKLVLNNILKGTPKEVEKFKVDTMRKCCKNTNITSKDIEFYVDDKGVVLLVNKNADVLEHRINISGNRSKFKKNLQNVFNFGQEVLTKEVAREYVGKSIRFIDKSIIEGDECYVFQERSGNEIVAVDKNLEKVYMLNRKDRLYTVLSKANVSDVLSDRMALNKVRSAVNNEEYTYDLCGYMKNDENDHVYSLVNVKDLEGTVDYKIAVSKVDGSLYKCKGKVQGELKANNDGTVSAVGCFEIDDNVTDISNWGRVCRKLGSKMLIRKDGTGIYYVACGKGKEVPFRLINEDGKTYMEMQNEKFLVEVKETNQNKYLCVHENIVDAQKGNSCWRMVTDGYSVFKLLDSKGIQ